jgi:hypothetical protein
MASMSGAYSIRHDPTAPFAFTRSLGGGLRSGIDLPHLPRLRMGRAVQTRRRWQIPVGELDGWRPFRRFASADAQLFVSAALLREPLHLPRQVFAKFPHEPKPVYVDWHMPLLGRQFHRLARGAAVVATASSPRCFPVP